MSVCVRLRSSWAASPPRWSATTATSIAPRDASPTPRSGAPDRRARRRSGCSSIAASSRRSSSKFAAVTAALKVGDPRDPDTVVGPMISEAEAARAEQWIADAVAGGARVVAGGRRSGALLMPTILTGRHRGDAGAVRRDLRPGRLGDSVRLARRGDRSDQCHRVRARRGRVHARPHAPPCMRHAASTSASCTSTSRRAAAWI